MRIKNLDLEVNGYVCGNKEIWLNPIQNDIGRAHSMNHGRTKKIHIFITNLQILNKYFQDFVAAFFDDPSNFPIVSIHVPKVVEDLAVVAKHLISQIDLNHLDINKEMNCPIRVFTFSKQISFNIPASQFKLVFEMQGDHLNHYIMLGQESIESYKAPYRRFGGKPGAVQNQVQANFPELFKDRIIEGFMQNCPEGILRTFNGREDIWDFICQKGEWNVEED